MPISYASLPNLFSMKSCLYLISLLTLLACSDRETSNQATVGDSAKATTEASPSSVSKPSTQSRSPEKPVVGKPAKWVYEKAVNAEGQTVYKASVTSPNRLEFGFPYTGGSTVTLTLRQRADSPTLYLQVSNGEFNRSFQGGTVRIQFDSQPPATYTYSAAENGSATIIFLDAVSKLVEQLKASEKMTIDVVFHHQGSRQIVFRTAGLTWKH